MKTYVSLVAAIFGAALVHAGTNNSVTSEASKNRFSFSLLPRSFQSKPQLDFNVVTEMTAAGRQHPKPTADRPVYYTGYIAPAKVRGATRENMSQNPPDSDKIGLLVARALQTRHFLPAQKSSVADIVLFIHWGAYSSPVTQNESRQPSNSKNLAALHSSLKDPVSSVDNPYTVDQDIAEDTAFDATSILDMLPLVLADRAKITALIDRARLIGGENFAREFSKVLQLEIALLSATTSSDTSRRILSEAGGGQNLYNNASPMMPLVRTSGPLATFMSRDQRTEELVEELFSSSYYIVVSAVDYESLAKNKPILLWRTKISSNSIGVSAKETAPTMIALGAEFFGKETDGSVGVTRRLNRKSNITVGKGEVQEYLDTP